MLDRIIGPAAFYVSLGEERLIADARLRKILDLSLPENPAHNERAPRLTGTGKSFDADTIFDRRGVNNRIRIRNRIGRLISNDRRFFRRDSPPRYGIAGFG